LRRAVDLTVKCQTSKAAGATSRTMAKRTSRRRSARSRPALGRNAGFTVPKTVADKCIKYVKSCQDPNSGGFRYQPNSGGAGFARTAAGIDALYSSGLYESKELERRLII